MDDKTFAQWRKQAEGGNPVAQYELGLCYEQGDGVPPDETKAFQWYQRAAKQGHKEAQFRLGLRDYESGKMSAFRWFRKAAKQGHTKAQFYLGKCYETGLGGTVNTDLAVRNYKKAAAEGDSDAMAAMERYQSSESEVTRDSFAQATQLPEEVQEVQEVQQPPVEVDLDWLEWEAKHNRSIDRRARKEVLKVARAFKREFRKQSIKEFLAAIGIKRK